MYPLVYTIQIPNMFRLLKTFFREYEKYGFVHSLKMIKNRNKMEIWVMYTKSYILPDMVYFIGYLHWQRCCLV